MAIEKFDKTNLAELRTAIDDALKGVAERYGLTIKTGKTTYDEKTFVMKLECAVAGTTREAEAFRQFASVIGRSVDDLGKEFKHAGVRYRLDGYVPSRSRFPMLVTRLDDGRRQLLTEVAVDHALSTAPKEKGKS